jgi:hypothetical protein
MKTMLTATLVACCTTIALAQEHTRSQGGTAPVDAKLVTENELVQVFRMSVPARAATPMHDVSPRVVVWLSDAHFVDRFADGTTKEETRKVGDVEWVPARRHAGENLSDKPMEFIAVVVRAASAGGHAPAHR